MIRTIATWGAEIGWRGQHQWKEQMRKLQYAALRKYNGAVVGARMESVNKIAAVESVETHLDAMQVRFMARAIGDPVGIWDLTCGAGGGVPGALDTEMMAKALVGMEGPRVEWGGLCQRVEIDVVDMGAGRESSMGEWEAAIRKVTRGRRVVFTDGSKMEGM